EVEANLLILGGRPPRPVIQRQRRVAADGRPARRGHLGQGRQLGGWVFVPIEPHWAPFCPIIHPTTYRGGAVNNSSPPPCRWWSSRSIRPCCFNVAKRRDRSSCQICRR